MRVYQLTVYFKFEADDWHKMMVINASDLGTIEHWIRKVTSMTPYLHDVKDWEIAISPIGGKNEGETQS